MKIVVIDNAGFHSLSKYEIPDNIFLLRIPPYSPELNPSEKIWAHIKKDYKNRVFENLDNVKKWLHHFIKNNLSIDQILGITHNKYFLDAFNGCFVS